MSSRLGQVSFLLSRGRSMTVRSSQVRLTRVNGNSSQVGMVKSGQSINHSSFRLAFTSMK